MGKDNRFSPDGPSQNKNYSRGKGDMREQLENLYSPSNKSFEAKPSHGTFLPARPRIQTPHRRVDSGIKTPQEALEREVGLELGRQLLERFTPEEARMIVASLGQNKSKENTPANSHPEQNPSITETPTGFSEGQVFLLPADHTSEQAHWKIVEIKNNEYNKDGRAMILEQIDGKQKGRREKFHSKRLTRFLRNLENVGSTPEKDSSQAKLEKPLYEPIKDFFTMFNSKNDYSLGGIRTWKKKWIDSGEIDTYRQKHGNITIPDEQITDAKKGIEFYIKALQTEGLSRELYSSIISSITINARILTGVQDPLQNDIEKYVTGNTSNEGNMAAIQSAIDKLKPSLKTPDTTHQKAWEDFRSVLRPIQPVTRLQSSKNEAVDTEKKPEDLNTTEKVEAISDIDKKHQEMYEGAPLDYIKTYTIRREIIQNEGPVKVFYYLKNFYPGDPTRSAVEKILVNTTEVQQKLSTEPENKDKEVIFTPDVSREDKRRYEELQARKKSISHPSSLERYRQVHSPTLATEKLFSVSGRKNEGMPNSYDRARRLGPLDHTEQFVPKAESQITHVLNKITSYSQEKFAQYPVWIQAGLLASVIGFTASSSIDTKIKQFLAQQGPEVSQAPRNKKEAWESYLTDDEQKHLNEFKTLPPQEFILKYLGTQDGNFLKKVAGYTVEDIKDILLQPQTIKTTDSAGTNHQLEISKLIALVQNLSQKRDAPMLYASLTNPAATYEMQARGMSGVQTFEQFMLAVQNKLNNKNYGL